MPCNSDYLAPTSREKGLQLAAQLFVYFKQKLKEPVGGALQASALDQYCNDDTWTPMLCGRLRDLQRKHPLKFNTIVYNARDPMSRKLATWWEEHLKADAQREAKERAEARAAKTREQALKKLTPAEKKALGVE